MTRKMRAAALLAVVVTGGLGSVGCVHTDRQGAVGNNYRKWVDPCYPERYSHVARGEVVAPFAQQVYNGHVMHQTVYNWYFEPGTDKLTPAGAAKLDSIARTRPAPDGKLWLQTARDLPPGLDPAMIPDARTALDKKRADTIWKYMAAQPAFTPVAYEIAVHDPVVPGIDAAKAVGAYRGSLQGYRGGITGAAGIGALGGGGAPIVTVNQQPQGGAPAGGGAAAPAGP